ncbi:DNA-directed RNA polymerase I subunit rpa49 [Iris pallida]|uniref:DNA-directed RNA polymerase I subunit rpa49 n=1 Tax=Iris pallida TaxID=29817 RepID=A0AAX6EZG5_IRIPA|nr:DNA-directed RNA polymerase I subunit rpa49 [Iris pallida]
MADSENEGESVRIENRRKKKKLSVSTLPVPSASGRIAPMVGYFPSGYNPAAADAGAEDPEVRVFRDRRHPSSRVELVVKPEAESKVEFVGTSYTGANAQHNPCNYALGILDKDAGTLKIVPIAANKIFRLEPRVMKRPSADVEEEGVVEGKKKEDLNLLYGTKKQRNMDKRYSSLQQLSGVGTEQEHLEYTNKINDEALEDNNEAATPNIPPHDLSADAPEKVYLLDEMILKSERNHLFDILEILQSGFGEKTKFWEENYYPSFVVHRLHMLRETKDQEEKEKFACILSYITHLVNFWKLTGVGTAGRFKSSRPLSNILGEALNKYKIPRVVFQRFMKLFVDAELDVIPTEKKELLIGYILVLTLFADKFRSDASDITKDLGLTNVNLYFLQLGCKTEKGFWTLTAPLKLRPVKRRGRKQKK